MKFNPKVGDLIYFRWDDHCSYQHAGWERTSELVDRLTSSVCETVGFVVAVNKTAITTAANTTVEENPDASQISTRLRRAITRGIVLKRFKYE